jgi:hypothetical protein
MLIQQESLTFLPFDRSRGLIDICHSFTDLIDECRDDDQQYADRQNVSLSIEKTDVFHELNSSGDKVALSDTYVSGLSNRSGIN